MNKIVVGWLYPDILNLHGERGNPQALKKVAKLLGVDLEVERIDYLDKKIDFDKYDILLSSAGEMKVIQEIVSVLNNQKEELLKYINDNKIILATGTSGAIFADNIKRSDCSFNGLNILNMDVVERNMVLGDDIYFKFNNMDITGCQIQMIDINLKNVKPLGKIIYGYGNNGKEEGARYKNVIFTNTLGPLLVKNPWFAEYLIKLALKNKNIKLKNKKIKYELETNSLKSTKQFIEMKMGS